MLWRRVRIFSFGRISGIYQKVGWVTGECLTLPAGNTRNVGGLRVSIVNGLASTQGVYLIMLLWIVHSLFGFEITRLAVSILYKIQIDSEFWYLLSHSAFHISIDSLKDCLLDNNLLVLRNTMPRYRLNWLWGLYTHTCVFSSWIMGAPDPSLGSAPAILINNSIRLYDWFNT